MQEALRRVAIIKNGRLNLSNLGLTELPTLPNRLQELYCSENQLTELVRGPAELGDQRSQCPHHYQTRYKYCVVVGTS